VSSGDVLVLLGAWSWRRIRLEADSWRCIPSSYSSPAVHGIDWHWLPHLTGVTVHHRICHHWRALHRV